MMVNKLIGEKIGLSCAGILVIEKIFIIKVINRTSAK